MPQASGAMGGKNRIRQMPHWDILVYQALASFATGPVYVSSTSLHGKSTEYLSDI